MTNAMSHCAPETADVLLAADGLPSDALQLQISLFANLVQHGDRRGFTPAESELHHSVLRLLCRVRDIHAERDKALKRADRQALLQKNSSANAGLRAEFDALVDN
ncbi:hypothetical protein [Nocardioides pyridinolyticus]